MGSSIGYQRRLKYTNNLCSGVKYTRSKNSTRASSVTSSAAACVLCALYILSLTNKQPCYLVLTTFTKVPHNKRQRAQYLSHLRFSAATAASLESLSQEHSFRYYYHAYLFGGVLQFLPIPMGTSVSLCRYICRYLFKVSLPV